MWSKQMKEKKTKQQVDENNGQISHLKKSATCVLK